MSRRNLCRIGPMILVTALSAGCAAHLQTKTVQTSDTYDLWASRMQSMPFVIHQKDGQIALVDVHGDPWRGSTEGLQDGSAQRVEVYEGAFAAPSATMCKAPMAPPRSGITASSDNVVAAICDRDRTVVSFSDTIRPRVLGSKTEYVSRVRHLLLEGIWESVAQEPEPLHT